MTDNRSYYCAHIQLILQNTDVYNLSFKSRVSFNLATLAFKTRQSGEPGYLASLLQLYQPTRELRSSSKDLLVVPTIKTRIGFRAFSHSVSTTWNNLPDEVKHCDNLPSFRKNLKTHLFKAAYDHWTGISASTTSLTTHGALKTLFTYLLTYFHCTTIRRELRLYKSWGTWYKSVRRWILTGYRTINPLDTRLGFASAGIEWVYGPIASQNPPSDCD